MHSKREVFAFNFVENVPIGEVSGKWDSEQQVWVGQDTAPQAGIPGITFTYHNSNTTSHTLPADGDPDNDSVNDYDHC